MAGQSKDETPKTIPGLQNSKGMNSFCWLASYPKSGNTWVRMFLASYLNDGSPPPLNSMPRLLTLSDDAWTAYMRVSPWPLDDLSLVDVLYLRNTVLLHMAIELAWGRPVPIKTHNANAIINQIKTIPIDMTEGAVSIVRDPRDVAVSYAAHMEITIDRAIEDMATENTVLYNDKGRVNTVFSLISSWSRNVTSWADTEEFPVEVIRYEDLHSHPIREFSKIIRILGWDFSRAKVFRAVEACGFNAIQALEQKHGFMEQSTSGKPFFRQGQVGAGRTDLTKSQIAKIESDHGEVMERMGYL